MFHAARIRSETRGTQEVTPIAKIVHRICVLLWIRHNNVLRYKHLDEICPVFMVLACRF